MGVTDRKCRLKKRAPMLLYDDMGGFREGCIVFGTMANLSAPQFLMND